MSPLREYKCIKCGHVKELFFHKESEIKHKKCPQCRKFVNWKQLPPMVAPGKVKDGTPKFYKEK